MFIEVSKCNCIIAISPKIMHNNFNNILNKQKIKVGSQNYSTIELFAMIKTSIEAIKMQSILY